MLELTQEDVATLKKEVDFVLDNIGINEVNVIEDNCNYLYENTEGITVCMNACSKIKEMNNVIRSLQNDTNTVCRNISFLIDNSKIIQ